MRRVRIELTLEELVELRYSLRESLVETSIGRSLLERIGEAIEKEQKHNQRGEVRAKGNVSR